MMGNLKVHLLGNPYAEEDGRQIRFPYRKAEGLFYYLCVQKSASREELAETFWGDEPEAAARKSLREAMYQLKKALGEDIFETKGHTLVSLNAARMERTDLEALEDGVLESRETEFLEHFHIKGSYEFDQWASQMRETCGRLVRRAARQCLYQADAALDLEGIEQYAAILMKNDPYSEKLHYEIMDIYAVHGCYHQAVQVYQALEKVLWEDLDVKPCREVSRLYQRVKRLEEHVSFEMPGKENGFFGRTEELYQISAFLADGKGKVLAIGGEMGVGKSRLLAKACELAEGYRMLPVFQGCYPEDRDEALVPWKEIFFKLEEKGFETEKCPSEEDKLLALFRKITREQTVVLFLDDVQHMDGESFRILNRVLRVAAPGGLYVCMTFAREFESELLEVMDSAVRNDWMELLWLECLEEKAAAELVRSLVREGEGPENLPALLYEFTDGNVFFLTEAVRQLQKEGDPFRLSRKASCALKASLAGMTEKERRLLDALAFLPGPGKFQELGRLTGMDYRELAEVLEKLSVRGICGEERREDGVFYTFTRNIVREYVRQSQTEGKKEAFLLTNF
ncbi:MAG: BTAD domain-containing putative transcriptional regulator [Eubacteriales bacterium]|nr:BTAD domain-containing putative transcriptional regulator [Eubacteriales bacterium]